jgi:hypothetical protein
MLAVGRGPLLSRGRRGPHTLCPPGGRRARTRRGGTPSASGRTPRKSRSSSATSWWRRRLIRSLIGASMLPTQPPRNTLTRSGTLVVTFRYALGVVGLVVGALLAWIWLVTPPMQGGRSTIRDVAGMTKLRRSARRPSGSSSRRAARSGPTWPAPAPRVPDPVSLQLRARSPSPPGRVVHRCSGLAGVTLTGRPGR